MNALANEVEAISFSLVVEVFEFNNPLEKKFVGKLELFPSDLALVIDPDSDGELAVMKVVLLREKFVKEGQPQAIEVEE
jgi:hypothetical protein